jgi:phage FluMu gp28-like protein
MVQILDKQVKLPALIQLRPYQQRWIDDDARFKLAVKSARIGFSFGTGIESLLDCIKHADGGTTWTVLSASKAQSVEFVEAAQQNLQAIGAVGQLYNEAYEDIDGVSSITQSRIQILDSRIIALPANPRTARGYPGNAILDEFAHHQSSYAIWAAITRQVALGHKLRALSTPNSEMGKYYDLAKDFGVADGVDPGDIVRKGYWSIHWVDVHKAVREGCPINIDEMRDLIKDDDTFAQEFLCVFLKAAGAWLPLELVATAEHDGATLDWPSGYKPKGPVFGGIDVARDRDTTVGWFDELVGDVSWTRTVMRIHGMPLTKQRDLLAPFVEMSTRTAIDSTGMGVGLFDMLAEKFPGRMMGINFAGTNDHGVKLKTDLAIRIKKRFEGAKSRIPHDNDIRQELMAIKRESTSNGVKFDAPRIELESAVAGGQKKKVYGHADSFWAKALADLACETGSAISTDFVASEHIQAHVGAGGYL